MPSLAAARNNLGLHVGTLWNQVESGKEPKINEIDNVYGASLKSVDHMHMLGDTNFAVSKLRPDNFSAGMSQKVYAQKIVGISPRILAEIERDVAIPTIGTLNKIGRPFGVAVGFVHKRPSAN